MASSKTIPILQSSHSNAYYNQGFSYSPYNSPQSPPFDLDPRSPRPIYPISAPMHNPTPPTRPRHAYERNISTRSSTEEDVLYQNIIARTKNDLPDALDDGFWGFLMYMEYNRSVVSTYTSGKDFIFDNSDNPIDNTSLGLSNLPGPQTNSKVQNIRRGVHEGIVVSCDDEGSVYLRNGSRVPVIIKGFDQPETCCTSEDVIRLRGRINPGQEFVMIFNIEEFRSQIGLQIVNNYNDTQLLNYMSLIRICFAEDGPGLKSPCWILLVNLKALNMVNNEEVRTEMEYEVARLNVANHQSIKKDIPSKKKKIETNKEALRKTRIELRKRGESIVNHMKYSWNDVYYKNEDSALNIEALKEEFEDPAVDYSDSDGDDDVITPQEESEMQVNLERLKTLVRNKRTGSTSVNTHQRPVKHWAKLSYIIKTHSGIEGGH